MRDKSGRPKGGGRKKNNPDFKGRIKQKPNRFNDKENVQNKFFATESGDDKKKPSRGKKDKNKTNNEIRLNRFIANAGICSRREADKYIKAGVVTINGKIVTELGTKVSFSDTVKFNDKAIKAEKPVYVLLNKPKDVVTTVDDPHADKTVMDLVKDACRERIYPVGRLDKNTTGVLLLTNDGDLASKLTHPKYVRSKIYHVFLDKNLKTPDFDKILKGVTLEDGEIFADSLSFVDKEDHKQIGIEIHSGKNRIVRRIFENLGYKVKKLDRVYFAGLTKKGLPRGKWRFLNDKEINMLRMGAFK
jgi:23S rRNA pseudouridine2605 synthase